MVALKVRIYLTYSPVNWIDTFFWREFRDCKKKRDKIDINQDVAMCGVFIVRWEEVELCCQGGASGFYGWWHKKKDGPLPPKCSHHIGLVLRTTGFVNPRQTSDTMTEFNHFTVCLILVIGLILNSPPATGKSSYYYYLISSFKKQFNI